MAEVPEEINTRLCHQVTLNLGQIRYINYVEKYIVVGCADGLIYFYKFFDDAIGVEFQCKQHGNKSVEKVQFWGNVRYVYNITGSACPRMAVSQASDRKLQYWQYNRHRSVQSVYIGGQILGQGWTNEFYSVYGKKVIRCHLVHPDDKISIAWSLTLPMPAGNSRIVAYSNSYHLNSDIFVLVYNQTDGNVTQFKIADSESARPVVTVNPWSTGPDHVKLLAAGVPGGIRRTGTKYFYSYNEHISICFGKKFLAFSIRDSPWKIYGSDIEFRSDISCVTMFNAGKCCVLGLQSGNLKGFMVNDYDSWRHMAWLTAVPFLNQQYDGPVLGVRHRVRSNRVIQIITGLEKRLTIHEITFPDACIFSEL